VKGELKPKGCWNCGSTKDAAPAGVDGVGNYITICVDCGERQEEE
jgi:hypothetical protein